METTDLYCPKEDFYDVSRELISNFIKSDLPEFRIYYPGLKKEEWEMLKTSLQDCYKFSFKVVSAPTRKFCGYPLYGIEFISYSRKLKYAITKVSGGKVKYHGNSLKEVKRQILRGWNISMVIDTSLFELHGPNDRYRICVYKDRSLTEKFNIDCWGFEGLRKVLSELGY